MTGTAEDIAATISDFWAYKPDKDRSPIVPSSDLFGSFASHGNKIGSVPISTFASIVHCPYIVVNLGAGNRPKFSSAAVERMKKGTDAHQIAESGVRARAKASAAEGGPPDWLNAPDTLFANAKQDLLEAPEVRVELSVEKLELRGKADGLLRTEGLVAAIERKPRTGMYKPASALQAMTYAIGGCLALKKKQASLGASWIITSYGGELGPGGRITQDVCDLIKQLGNAYSRLHQIGDRGDQIPGLSGPGVGKCARCEYVTDCRYRIDAPPNGQERSDQPIWKQYAKRKAAARSNER